MHWTCLMKRINAKWAWLALGGFIIAWDVLEDDQLSHAFRRAPMPATIVVCTLVVGHLYEVIPKRVDPIHLALSKNRRA